ncbi:MAG: cytidylate kinase-like family protein [Bacteroidales bacterium]|jgi:cytidylate kinase|nr:cytidylate kinase-like family protein [Bacteroidales bacterium]
MDEKFVITIGRQLGSGGKQVGEELAARFGILCYDKELIQIASRESGLGREFFEQADEKTRFSIFGGLLGFRSTYADEGYANNYLCNEYLFKIQSDVIHKLADEQSCIFVGRCADYILREHPRCINVFITAEMKDRIRRVSDDRHISDEKAKELIERADKKRAGYYNYYSNKTWGMAASYHMCINSSLFGIEGAADFIQTFVKKKLEKGS